MSGWARTPDLAMSSAGTSEELVAATRSPEKQAGHAEDVEDGLVDAVGGEGAEAFEVLLAFELEGPGDHADEVDLIFGGEVGEGLHGGGGVGGVDGAVAVGVVGVLFGGAGGAAFGVGFGEDDGQVVPLGRGGYGAEAVGCGARFRFAGPCGCGRFRRGREGRGAGCPWGGRR